MLSCEEQSITITLFISVMGSIEKGTSYSVPFVRGTYVMLFLQNIYNVHVQAVNSIFYQHIVYYVHLLIIIPNTV